MRVEDQYLDVLQNIEFAIVGEFRKDRAVLDMNVRDAVNALVRHYEAEEQQSRAPEARLSDLSRRVFDSVRAVCEWRLGRTAGPLPLAPEEPPAGPLTPAEIIACLRRIRKSIDRWTKEGGRQGYLSFAARFIV